MKKIFLCEHIFFATVLSCALLSCSFNDENETKETPTPASTATYSISYFDGESENLFLENSGDSFTDLFKNPCKSFFNVATKELSGSEYVVDFVKTDDSYCYLRFTDCSSSTPDDWLSYWYLFIGQQQDTCFFVPVREEEKSYPKSGCITGLKIISDNHIRLTVYGKEIDFKADSGKTISSEKGIEPTKPTIRGLYLSNLQGKHKLENGNEFEISSKINITASESKYWFAHAVGYQHSSEGEYNLLLCHESNTDPGITGKEPFISRQGIFWSRMNIKSSDDSWTVSWSSTWTDFPHTAFSLPCDQSYTCPAAPIEKNRYEYIFYFGNPTLKDGFYETEKGEEIGRYSLETYEQKIFTLGELLNLAGIDSSKIKVPEEKENAGWWYSTNSITGILESYRYGLDESSEISYSEKEIYMELKDKAQEPASTGDGFVPSGTYAAAGTAWEGYSLTVDGKSATLNYPEGSKTFEIVPNFEANPNYQDFGGDYPNIRIFYNVNSKYRIKIYKSTRSGLTIFEWEK